VTFFVIRSHLLHKIINGNFYTPNTIGGHAAAGSTWTWIGGTVKLVSPSDWALESGPGNATGIPETGDAAINNDQFSNVA
jgi:hypothetical protein